MTFLSLPDFRYEVSNKAHDELLGRTDIVGKTVREILPEMEAQGILDILKKVAEKDEIYSVSEAEIYFLINGKKQKHFLDFFYSPVKNQDGVIYGIAVQGYDVTEKVLSRSAAENERENFRRLFKQTPELVCVLSGPEHVFEFVNEAHIKVLGFDATGMKVREAQPESIEVYGILDDVYNTGKTAELHEIPVTVGNRIRYFNLTYSARHATDGEINGIMIIGVEITEQIQSRQKIKVALNAASMGMYEIDLIHNLFFSSPKSDEIFGHGHLSGDFVSVTKKIVHPDDFNNVVEKTFAAISEKRPYSDEFRIVSADGTLSWVLSQGEAFYDDKGKPVSFLGVVQDITHRKNIELKLNEALKTRDEFLSIASHELKTPVTSMKLQLQMAEKSLAIPERFPTPEKMAKTLEMSIRQINKLTKLIDDLLDVSRINTGRLTFNFEKVDLKILLQEVLERFTFQFQNAGCEVSLKMDERESFVAECDRFRMDQVITNLITNVIKYAAGKPVIISLKKSESSVQIIVQDFGMGIEPYLLNKIFDRFERSDLHNHISGMGLGLFIARMIVEAHGGQISVTSEPGEGSTFTVDIPNTRPK